MIIIKAAIMFSNGEIIEGHDYGHISCLADKLSLSGDRVHGFVTSSGSFVLPDEASKIALTASQISKKVDELTPDMLWSYVEIDDY